jgi:enoyl-CoA hydratase/carnithine racemase
MTALTQPQFETIEYSVEDRTAWIRLNRPEVLNAFSSRMYGEVKNALRMADHDDEIDTIAITGSGKAFGTGGDLKELLDCLDSSDPLAIYRFDDALPFDVLRRTSKTTFAVVNGICIAGGLMITLLCDFAIASNAASFGAPEGRVGFADAFLPSLLYGRVSTPQIKYLLYTGKSISATQAVDLGLITMAVPHDELITATNRMISEVRETSPLSRKLYKSYLDRLLPPAHIDDSHPAMRSPEAISRLRKFAVRRDS